MAMPLVSLLVLVFVFAAFCIGWVKVFGIRLSSIKVLLLGILLSVSGGLLSLVITSMQIGSSFMDAFGLGILLLGLIIGVAGFFIKDEPAQDKDR